MLLLALSLLRHSLKGSAVQGLARFIVSALTIYAFAKLCPFCIGQADSPNCVPHTSSETLNRLLMQCPAYSVPRHCLFSTLNVLGLLRPDVKMCYFRQYSLRRA